MRQRKLGIWDDDRDYALALAAAIAMDYREYRVTVIRERSQLAGAEWDVLLVGEGTANQGDECWNGGNCQVVIWLTDDEVPGVHETMAEDRGDRVVRAKLYRYESVSSLVKGVRFWYSFYTGEHVGLTGSSKLSPLIGVTAASDRALQETAQMLAEELAAMDYSVLYLSFDEFPVKPPLPQDEKRACLEDYLYYLLGAKKEKVCQQTELFLGDLGKGYQGFLMRGERNPLRALSMEETEYFMERVLGTGFDYVVIHLGAGTFASTALLLAYCVQLLFPEAASTGEGQRNRNMISHLGEQTKEAERLQRMISFLGQRDESLLRWSEDGDGERDFRGEAEDMKLPGGLLSQDERRKEVKWYVRRVAEPVSECAAAYGEGNHGGDSRDHQQQKWGLKR